MKSHKFTIIATITLTGVFLAGCCEERKAFVDTAGPEWSYDKPFYFRAPDGPEALTEFDDPAPQVYLDNRLIPVPRPEVGDSRKAPRTSIWLTADGSMTWEKVGYFGLQQSNFYLPVEEDGTYGIRFIGPGIPPSSCRPPKPHTFFLVDTMAPEVSVFITPNKEFYVAGEEITIEWVAIDSNLKADSARVNVCLDCDVMDLEWAPLGQVHPCPSQINLVIPDEVINKVMTIRVSVEDLSGNVGSGYSCPLPVVYEPLATQPATTPEATAATVLQTPRGPQVLTTMPAEYPSISQ